MEFGGDVESGDFGDEAEKLEIWGREIGGGSGIWDWQD